jgi:hypothetical protein
VVSDHAGKSIEERGCIMGTRAGFGVILDCESPLADEVEALDGTVVGIDMTNLERGLEFVTASRRAGT